MKKLLLIAVLMFSETSYSQENSENICFETKNISDLKLDKKELKKYTIKIDNFKERTFISPSNSNGSIVYPYLSIDNKTNIGCLRMVTNYRDYNWLFVKSMNFIIDGEKFEYEFTNPTRNVGVGSSKFVTEMSDIPVTNYLYNFLEKYSKIQDKEQVRYNGKDAVKDVNDVLPKTHERINEMITLINQLKK
ncbi:hypothetical protein [Empedobacter tilapiae]